MAAKPSQQLPPPQGSSLSFIQGFLLGQLSIALLIFFFIKFFIFGEPPPADERALHLSSLRRARTLAHQRSRSSSLPLRHKHSRSIIRNPATSSGPTISTILAKTYYNVKGHQPESLDWFNVLIAQTIAQLRADARQDGAVLTSLTEVLNGPGKPDYVGEIRVTEIALGDEFPIFSNCRIMAADEGVGGTAGTSPGDEGGRLQARMDVDLSDVITLGVETTLVLNYPKPLVAVLPVALAVSVVRFSGTLSVSFIPSIPEPSPSPNLRLHAPSTHASQSQGQSTSGSRPTTLAFTFLDDYRLDLSVRSLVGSRSRLQDVPKIAQLVEARLHAWFDERAVEPRFQQIVLPSLWPRKRNTRGGEEEGDEAVEGGEVYQAPRDDVERPSEGVEGQDARPRAFVPTAPPGTLEARMEAEGAKMREAEVRAVERLRASQIEREGMRWRGEREPHQNNGEWRGQRDMPGAMPGP
ncbi:hypothetical protein K432DRAFT_422298 [Lepidopterella palustris CBS 459.81]|uniref:Maintenance of mitochondrial morphology protein 1 n=1 Tax=Lepidopterella palustris CBS 459.81 TaxID=1314670 RepID=A0A8E2JJK2_9PEZI|nr:hypothetical protein K432DRAFT_422298 [Lepidopterella palustris CBS 459.81]